MFRDLTLEAVAQWPPGNYQIPSEQRGPAIYYVAGVFLSIATASLAARMYSRLWIRRYFGPDDALILFAWVRRIPTIPLEYSNPVLVGLLGGHRLLNNRPPRPRLGQACFAPV